MDIIHSIAIKTTPERLYEAVTTQAGLAGWWTPQTKAEPRVGAINEFSFGPKTVKFRVDELLPGRLVVWSPVQVPMEWQKSRIIFDFVPLGRSVKFTFSLLGLPTPYDSYGFFNFMWAQYVRSLKLLLETGQGEPYGSPASQACHPAE